MWQRHSQTRLIAWADLRNQCKLEPDLDTVINTIHSWWQHAPLVLHYLHWDLVKDWPDPWDLIAENTYCDLAKCLGISYTILMLDRTDINSLSIQETKENEYIVSLNQGKYILNWDVGQVLNINSTNSLKIARSMDSAMFKNKIR